MENVTDGLGLTAMYTVVTEIVTVLSPVLTDESNLVSSDSPVRGATTISDNTPGISVEDGGTRLPSFPPSPLYQFLLKVIFIGVVIVITIIANTLVLVSFATTRKLQTYTNYYLVALAVADLVSGGITPAVLNVSFIIGYWPFGVSICRAFIYLNNTFINATFLLTFVICLDRYRATSMPLKHLQEKNRKHALKMILPGFVVPALLWAVMILILPGFEVFKPLPPYMCHIPYVSNKILLMASSVFFSWLPIIGTLILYAILYFKILRRRPARRSNYTSKERKSVSLGEESGSGAVSEMPKGREMVNCEATCEQIENSEKVTGTMEIEAETCTDRTNKMSKVADARQAALTTEPPSRGAAPYNLHRYQKRLTSSRRATRTLSYIILVMVLSGTPWFFYSVLLTATNIPSHPFFNWLVGFVVHLSSVTNPLLYAICNPVFKEAFLRILCRCCRSGK